MRARIGTTLILAAALLCGTSSRSRALVLGGGKVESDCLIALGVGDVEGNVPPFGPKALPSIQCTDCDPDCDGDGVGAANGSCTFGVRACVNAIGTFVACTAATITKAKAVAKPKGAPPIDLNLVPDGAKFVCSAERGVPVAVKRRKAGERPGTVPVSLRVSAADGRRDRDKFLLVCNPRPAGEACPGTTTTTTLPPQILGTPSGLRTTASVSGGPPRFVLRWNFDEGTIPVDTFLVHDGATVVATVPGSARAADVELLSGTGVHRFRVSAVSFDAITSTLSSELAIDTTPRAVMIADKTTDEVFELFSVVAGSGLEPTPISGPLVAGGDVQRFVLSPDGRNVAFEADKEIDGVVAIFVAPLDGSRAPVKVSGTFVAGGAPAQTLAFSPDGSRLAFTGDKLVDERVEVLVAPVDGSAEPVAVSGALAPDDDVEAAKFAWAPDGRHLAFVAGNAMALTAELFVADAAGGGQPTKVSGTLAEGLRVLNFAWAPDGSKLAFTAGFSDVRVAVPDGTSEPISVSGTLLPFATFNSFTPLWSPDSTRIAMSGDLLTDGVFEVFVMSADGVSGPFRVSGASQAFSDVVAFRWAPEGTRLVFSMDKNLDDADEVFIANASGGAEPIRVSGAFASGEEAFDPQWSPRGDRVAFVADGIVNGQFELFVAEADVVDGALPASGPIGPANDVFAFEWAPDGASLMLAGTLESAANQELFVTPAVGGSVPVKVSGTMQANGSANGLFFGFSRLGN